jgi:hypothetical protein
VKAEDFYKLYKRGKRMENEYFIAVDKETLFEMMEAFAEMKIRSIESGNIPKSVISDEKNTYKVLKHN